MEWKPLINGGCYDAVVFDLDGTLLDTLQDLADSANEVLSRYGMPQYSIDEIRGFVGNGIRNLIRCAVPGGEANHSFNDVYEDFLKYYGEHCQDATKPYPGILSLLTDLKKECFGVAIVSNKADFAVKKLCSFYFGELIKVAAGEREGYRRKPERDLVLLALKELNVSPEKAIYVGDSDVDILTAKNAGIDCVTVTWGFRSREFLLSHGAVPEMMASDTDELLKLLVKK